MCMFDCDRPDVAWLWSGSSAGELLKAGKQPSNEDLQGVACIDHVANLVWRWKFGKHGTTEPSELVATREAEGILSELNLRRQSFETDNDPED